MLVALVAKMRNGRLLRYRKDNCVTQKAAAELAGISPTAWCAIEGMRFKDVSWRNVRLVADFLEVSTEEICPEAMRKMNLRLEATAYKECEANLLMARDTENRLTLPSPADTEDGEQRTAMQREAIDDILKTLTYREREIIKLRYGIGDGYTYTLEEISRIFKVTRERVRQVEAKAIRKLQDPVRAKRLEVSMGLEQSPPIP